MTTNTTDILGYCSPLTIHAGESIDLKISSNGPKSCSIELLRVLCADIDPIGPGEAYEESDFFDKKEIPLEHQPPVAGSYAIVDPSPNFHAWTHLDFSVLIFPTIPSLGIQPILSWGNLCLAIDDECHLQLNAANQLVTTRNPVLARRWYQVSVNIDLTIGRLCLGVEMLKEEAICPPTEVATTELTEPFNLKLGGPLAFASDINSLIRDCGSRHRSFNGKLEKPSFSVDNEISSRVCWDFSQDISSQTIVDIGPNSYHGKLINMPMRGATGHNWDGSVESWVQDPAQYGAIHFHNDDVTDCGWDTSLSIEIPQGTQSGYWIARLTTKGVKSDVPFFISVKPGLSNAKLLFIAPTATYMAYANTHIKFDSHNTENLYEAPMALSEDELFLNLHREFGLSHYDTHHDHSGVIYCSSDRPMLNVRPGLYTFNYVNDTHILKWLEKEGFEYDVATDSELHKHGMSLLAPYRVVMTGSHPEYYSTQMWDAVSEYQDSGGRHMYMGGNGFYWRIAYSPDSDSVIENRRGVSGVRTWEGEPGEHHLSFTGEPGGLWRTNGRPPQKLVGVGFSATLFIKSTYFVRSEESKHQSIDFIFRGILSKRIGDYGFRGGGCVGLEIDRVEKNLGSPANITILASSEQVGRGGLLSGEEYITTTRNLDGETNDQVRADMIFFKTAADGAVWSSGSIAWTTSLLWNDGKNDVSKITKNVLQRFLDPSPFL